jgi:hypothetical protein
MLVAPVATLVTTPVVASIVAIPVAALLHVPPVVVLASVAVLPKQVLSVPVIAAGKGLTVRIVVVIQPVGTE